MDDLSSYCPSCRDRRAVSAMRRSCLCGAVSARLIGDTVVLAGPGQISVGPTVEGRDQIRVVRPSAVGT